MIDGLKVLALIPARGGSKGLPGKNVRPLAGKPLIGWTIEAALRSKYIDRTVLTSDDEDIMAHAREFGCEVPFKRPDDLAGDEALIAPVIIHALDALGEAFDLIVLLQPTSPLRRVEDIDGALRMCIERDAPACVAVTQAGKPPQWMYNINADDGRMTSIVAGGDVMRRQDVAPTYVINGAVYVARVDWFRDTRGFIGDDTVAFEMAGDRSVDIDTALDFAVAETLMAHGAESA